MVNFYNVAKDCYDIETNVQKGTIRRAKSHQFGSFYACFRPMAMLSKFLGAFPLCNACQNNGRFLRYKFVSLETIWSGGLFFLIIALLYTTSNLFKTGQSSNRKHLWKVIVAYMIFVRASISFVLCHYGARFLPSLMAMLESYHEKRDDVIPEPNLKNIYKWGITTVSVTVLSVTIHVSFTFGYIHSLWPDELTYRAIASFVFALLGVWQLVPTFSFIILAIYLMSGFDEIQNALRCILPIDAAFHGVGPNREKYPRIPDGKIDQIRRLHSLLQLATCHLSDSYGFMLAVDYLVSVIMFVINIYIYICKPAHGNSYLLSLSLFNMFIILIYLNVSYLISESGHAVTACLKSASLEHVSPACRREIHEFLSEIAVGPVTVTAAGFFIIGRAQISSILGSIATYLVVMIQFSPYLDYLMFDPE